MKNLFSPERLLASSAVAGIVISIILVLVALARLLDLFTGISWTGWFLLEVLIIAILAVYDWATDLEADRR
jgi:hypothetical protein